MKSMTGIGRATGVLPDGSQVTVVVRGVNHRFLDLGLKLREEFLDLEPAVRSAVASTVSRGHVDVTVRTNRNVRPEAVFDPDLAFRMAEKWREAAVKAGLPTALTASDLLTLPGVVRTSEETLPSPEAAECVLACVREALASFDASRKSEGAALALILEKGASDLESLMVQIDAERAGISARLLEGLKERMRKLLEGQSVDESRLLAEAALLADRADITEEVHRLFTHLGAFRQRLRSEGPAGKQLDFLVQEFHRETNTASQKCRELPVLRLLLEAKAVVEALKEQVQNVE